MLALWFGTGLLAREAIFSSAADALPGAFTVANDNFGEWVSAPVAFAALSSAADAEPDPITFEYDPAPAQWAIGG